MSTRTSHKPEIWHKHLHSCTECTTPIARLERRKSNGRIGRNLCAYLTATALHWRVVPGGLGPLVACAEILYKRCDHGQLESNLCYIRRRTVSQNEASHKTLPYCYSKGLRHKLAAQPNRQHVERVVEVGSMHAAFPRQTMRACPTRKWFLVGRCSDINSPCTLSQLAEHNMTTRMIRSNS